MAGFDAHERDMIAEEVGAWGHMLPELIVYQWGI